MFDRVTWNFLNIILIKGFYVVVRVTRKGIFGNFFHQGYLIYLYEQDFMYLKTQHQCKFFRQSVCFGLKFSLHLLEYEAKGFIHEKKNFCSISRFS